MADTIRRHGSLISEIEVPQGSYSPDRHMHILKKVLLFYLRSLDTLIRFIGTCIILGILVAALGGLLHSINWMIFGEFSQGNLHPWLGLVLLPPLLRLGILAGGFSVPPLIHRKKSAEGIA